MHQMEEQLHNAEIDVEFADRTEEALYEEWKLGETAREFFESDVGRYVLAAAKEETEEIERKLLKVSPWRKRRIAQLQMEHKAVTSGIRWIAETIQIAMVAEAQLEQYREV